MDPIDPRGRSFILLGLTMIVFGALLQFTQAPLNETTGPVRAHLIILPPDGLALYNGTVDLPIGNTTALDALLNAAHSADIAVKVTGQGETAFVVQIASWANEGRCGWQYFVNDQWINQSAGIHALRSGDRVRWSWGCDG